MSSFASSGDDDVHASSRMLPDDAVEKNQSPIQGFSLYSIDSHRNPGVDAIPLLPANRLPSFGAALKLKIVSNPLLSFLTVPESINNFI